MTAKQYLSEIKKMRHDLEILRREAKDYHISFESIRGIDYSASKVQTSPKNNMEEAAWAMLQRHENVIKEIGRLTEEINRRLETIREMSRTEYSQILLKRYDEYESFEQIAVELHYNYNYTCTLHGEALQEIEKRLKFSEDKKELSKI